jgi:hypothetical protein
LIFCRWFCTSESVKNSKQLVIPLHAQHRWCSQDVPEMQVRH